MAKRFLASENINDLAHFKAMCSSVKTVVKNRRSFYWWTTDHPCLRIFETVLISQSLLPLSYSFPWNFHPFHIDSTVNFLHRSCNLLCSYFFSVFTSSFTAPSRPLIAVDCFELLAIPFLPLLSLSSSLVNLIPMLDLVRMDFLTSS